MQAPVVPWGATPTFPRGNSPESWIFRVFPWTAPGFSARDCYTVAAGSDKPDQRERALNRCTIIDLKEANQLRKLSTRAKCDSLSVLDGFQGDLYLGIPSSGYALFCLPPCSVEEPEFSPAISESDVNQSRILLPISTTWRSSRSLDSQGSSRCHGC